MSTADQSRAAWPPRTSARSSCVGPTASGKSALSIALAERLIADGHPAEIVNADSMLVYRGMDIGTAKPTAAERARVPHHLLDVLDVTETATVAEFQRRARAAIADCHARGVMPIVVGGSALYVRAIVDDFDFPRHRPGGPGRLGAGAGRASVPRRCTRDSPTVDPAAAARIQPGNGRRIVRALEVIELTGRPYAAATAASRATCCPAWSRSAWRSTGPPWTRGSSERVDAMWAAGLVAEVCELAGRGLRDGRDRVAGAGLPPGAGVPRRARSTRTRRDRRTVAGTRKFARRQDSWFRQDPRISWLRARSAGPGRRRRRRWPAWKTDRHAQPGVRQGSRHRERLRAPARPRRRCVPSPTTWCAGSATGEPGSARTASCGPSLGRARRRRGTATPTCGSWTTATPTARSPRCAATGSGCFVRYLVDEGLASGPVVPVGTRAGPRRPRCCRTVGSGSRWARPGGGAGRPGADRRRTARSRPSRWTSAIRTL